MVTKCNKCENKKRCDEKSGKNEKIIKKSHSLELHAGNAKKTWKIIREIWPGKNAKNTVNKIGDTSDNYQMACELNEHFTSIGPKLSAKIPDISCEHTVLINDETSFTFTEIKYEDVRKELGKLSPSKSCGIDGLTARLVKACGDAIIQLLLHMMNESISKGIFPQIWKLARVTPLFRGKNQ